MLYSFFVGIYCFRIVIYYYICFDITIFDSFHRYWVYIFEINPGVEVVAARNVRTPNFPGALAPCAASWVGREGEWVHNQTSTYIFFHYSSILLFRSHDYTPFDFHPRVCHPCPKFDNFLLPPDIKRRGDGIIKIFDIVSIIDSLPTSDIIISIGTIYIIILIGTYTYCGFSHCIECHGGCFSCLSTPPPPPSSHCGFWKKTMGVTLLRPRHSPRPLRMCIYYYLVLY